MSSASSSHRRKPLRHLPYEAEHRAEERATKRPRYSALVGEPDATPSPKKRPKRGLFRDVDGRSYWYASKANAHQDSKGGVWLAFQSPLPTIPLHEAKRTGMPHTIEAVGDQLALSARVTILKYGFLKGHQRFGLVKVNGLDAAMLAFARGGGGGGSV